MIYAIITIIVLILGLCYHFWLQDKEFKRIIKVIAKSPITLILFLWGWLGGKD